MKVFLFILLFTGFYFTSIGQVVNGKQTKLADLYQAGKYEKCLIKADNMSYDEKTSNDPEIYLYISMCFYQLSVSEDEILREDYKDGFKDAVKYANKFMKKDKKNELFPSNADYINMLKKDQLNYVLTYLKIEDYRRAKLQLKQYEKLLKDDDYGFDYYMGIIENLGGSSAGDAMMQEAKTKLNAQLASNSYKMDEVIKPTIKEGILKYTEKLVGEKKLAQAKDVITVGHSLFPNDGYITMQFNMMNKK